MVAIKKIQLKKLHKIIPPTLWFLCGAILGFFFLMSFAYILFAQIFRNAVFPGVMINGQTFSGKSRSFVQQYFDSKNAQIGKNTLTILVGTTYATISAQQLQLGYNSNLLADQALSVGRSGDIFSRITLVFTSYLSETNLAPSYTFSENALQQFLAPLSKATHVDPVDAQFSFTNNRVTTFKPSANGQDIDVNSLVSAIDQQIPYLLLNKTPNVQFVVPLKIIPPKITTDKANNLGIQELIGSGTSLFQHSIASRVYNIELAASRINGVIIAPGEEFSFDKALGDVSSYTGYKSAYVIQNGHTVLGDGGGVCQVSTTMFRAILYAGLPITERHAHDYRVGYYEEDSPPGFDATVYVPTVDLKFINTTGHYILIQTAIDPSTLRLTINLYGVKDGRQVTITTPVVTNEIPAPAALYQDDPDLPKGTTQQTDFAANGATVTFSRTVVQNGKPIINETYTSVYRPWQAVYLVGSKG